MCVSSRLSVHPFYQCRVAMDVAALLAAAKGSDDSKALLTAARAADAAGVARILNEAQHKKMDLGQMHLQRLHQPALGMEREART